MPTKKTVRKPKVKSRTKAKAKTRTSQPSKKDKVRALKILADLRSEHPDAHCELNFTNGLELLIGTILAAQCTDARVNMVTEEMFKKYPTAAHYLELESEELEEEIRSTGFFRNKTKSIKKACQTLVDQFGGDVPDTMDELLSLAGVGRKTANCILGNVFGVPGIVVDTHMLRISRILGFTENTDPTRVEFDLMELVPEDEWINLSHLIPWHGRRVCKARKPLCDDCAINNSCPKLF
jgi:endonuclease-3